MCGIFGAIDLDGAFDRKSYDQFVGLTDLVRYRGPDDAGYLTLNLKQGEVAGPNSFDVFLGSRRLSILDLSSAGHQPMTDAKGRWIVFNGEIFNFVELRRDLEARRHRFSTGTDTEVLLHVYDEYGEAGFENLNGMWALAIADVEKRLVILSRDRFSIKPMYLFDSGHRRHFFSSEIKQLLPLLDRRELNPDVMAAFLAQGLVDHSPETFFRGITRLPPRTNLVISFLDGKHSRRQYWDFEGARSENSTDTVEEFRALLLDSTRIRLRSDVPVGCLLSGGLDSSALVAACMKTSEKEVKTYSIISQDSRISEERYIDVVTECFRLKNYKMLLDGQGTLDSLDEVLNHNDEPFASFNVVALYKILEAVKQRSDAIVILSGQGADEILLGYLKFYFFYLLELTRKRNYGKVALEVFLSLIQRTVLRQFNLTEGGRYIPMLKDRWKTYLLTKKQDVPIWMVDDLRQRQILDIENYSLPALTHYEDRTAMAHSLEIRHPFLDHRLVDFVLNLPAERKLRNGWTKRILRESFPELPARVRWRKDKGYFCVPEKEWLKSTMDGLVRISFASSYLDEYGLIDKNAFLDAYTAFQNGQSKLSANEVSRTLIAELWARKFF
jgi:asparagine synthase (glutamine-hydrolysing)